MGANGSGTCWRPVGDSYQASMMSENEPWSSGLDLVEIELLD